MRRAHASEMLRRVPELFASVDVSLRMGMVLFDAPLQRYNAHCWYGGIYHGERPEAILKTRGSDIVAECLAYTTMHLVQRVADAHVRGYTILLVSDGDRAAARLGGLFATLLIDRVITGMTADVENVGFQTNDPHHERTLTTYRAVAEIMYPDSREMRASISNVEDDPLAFWSRVIDYALYLTTVPLAAPDRDALLALVRTIDETIESFYLYFLATSFGNAMYERFGI